MTVHTKGQQFDRFTIVECISEGGYCEVWKGTGKSDQKVAVKVPINEIGRRMIRAEGKYFSRLRDVPGIVDVLHFQGDDEPVLVFPWVGNRTFRTVLYNNENTQTRAQALEMFFNVVETVADVHSKNLIHGDLKPENILITADGTPYLTDFGLAHELQSHRLGQSLVHSMKTDDNIFGGTLAYLGPEAVKGAEPSPQGDVYALGVIFHEILLGQRPDKALGPDDIKGLLHPEAVDILTGCLQSDPALRYANANDLKQEMEEVRNDLIITGFRRRLKEFWRIVKVGLAALFVCIRYLSVAALLSIYLFIVVYGVLYEPWLFVAFIPIGILHSVIRWEGPETSGERDHRVDQSKRKLGAYGKRR